MPAQTVTGEYLRSLDQVSLCVVHTNFQQGLFYQRRLDKLGNGAFAHDVANMIDHFHHRPIDRVVQHIFNEAAINFQIIDR